MDTSPPASFVPADDRIVAPLAHGGIWLAVGIGAGVLAICLLAWMVHTVPDPATRASARRLAVIDRYLAEIAAVQQRFDDRLIDERQLHHELSSTVRRFATECGITGARAMTAADLHTAGFRDVSGVVAGYQTVQFMKAASCDPRTSVAAAQHLIESMAGRAP